MKKKAAVEPEDDKKPDGPFLEEVANLALEKVKKDAMLSEIAQYAKKLKLDKKMETDVAEMLASPDKVTLGEATALKVKLETIKLKLDKKVSDIANLRLEQIRKAMGISEKDEAVHLADKHISIKDVISTGMADLDRLMTPMFYEKEGRGGLPRGFCAEFFGPYAGGKSSLCMKLAATVTQRGGFVLWMDPEGSFVKEWAEQQGIDTKLLIHIDSSSGTIRTGEDYLQKLESVVRKGLVELAVVDSVTALQPQEVLDQVLEKEARVGAPAKMMSRAMPKLIMAAKEGNCAIVFINQIRQKVGIVYGNPETTPGGEALKFYSSLRLRLAQITNKNGRGITKDEEDIGIRTTVKIVKNRFGPPDKETIMPIYYGKIKPHPLDIVLDAALSLKIVKSRSSKQSNGEMVQTFSYDPVDSSIQPIKILGMDEFKKVLGSIAIKEIAKRVSDELPFDPEVNEYLKSLENDDPTETGPVLPEGDPGE